MKSGQVRYVVAAMVCGGLVAPLVAGDWTFQEMLAEGRSADNFGVSVDVQGSRAIVGAWGDSTFGTMSGAAYVFERDADGWGLMGKLLPDTGARMDWFGKSVALWNDYAVVGCENNDERASEAGAAYVYHCDGGVWRQVQKLHAHDTREPDRFGCSVAIQGDWLAIGGRGRTYPSQNNCGGVWMFHREGGQWVERAALTGVDITGRGHNLGQSVAMDGEWVLAGASGGEWQGKNSGTAFAFRREGTTWRLIQEFGPPDPDHGDQFGGNADSTGRVDISGDWALVGAAGHDPEGIAGAGAAYLYRWDGVGWQFRQKLTAPSLGERDEFGQCVGISGTRALVGAHRTDHGGVERGAAYVYELDDETWELAEVLTADDAEDKDWYGYSVDVDGITAMVGVRLDDPHGSGSGSVYVYTPEPGSLLVLALAAPWLARRRRRRA